MLFNSVGGCSLVLDLFIDCAGSSFLCADRNEIFFSCRQAEATPRCKAQASHCAGFSCCRVRAPCTQASVVVGHVAHGYSRTRD